MLVMLAAVAVLAAVGVAVAAVVAVVDLAVVAAAAPVVAAGVAAVVGVVAVAEAAAAGAVPMAAAGAGVAEITMASVVAAVAVPAAAVANAGLGGPLAALLVWAMVPPLSRLDCWQLCGRRAWTTHLQWCFLLCGRLLCLCKVGLLRTIPVEAEATGADMDELRACRPCSATPGGCHGGSWDFLNFSQSEALSCAVSNVQAYGP